MGEKSCGGAYIDIYDFSGDRIGSITVALNGFFYHEEKRYVTLQEAFDAVMEGWKGGQDGKD